MPGTSKGLPALFEEVMQQKKVNEELELKLRAAHNALGRSDKASGLKGKVGWLGQQLISRKMLVSLTHKAPSENCSRRVLCHLYLTLNFRGAAAV